MAEIPLNSSNTINKGKYQLIQGADNVSAFLPRWAPAGQSDSHGLADFDHRGCVIEKSIHALGQPSCVATWLRCHTTRLLKCLSFVERF